MHFFLSYRRSDSVGSSTEASVIASASPVVEDVTTDLSRAGVFRIEKKVTPQKNNIIIFIEKSGLLEYRELEVLTPKIFLIITSSFFFFSYRDLVMICS